MARLKALFSDETGATGIEYGFLASLVAVAAVSGFEKLGNAIDDTFGYVDEEYAAAQQ